MELQGWKRSFSRMVWAFSLTFIPTVLTDKQLLQTTYKEYMMSSNDIENNVIEMNAKKETIMDTEKVKDFRLLGIKMDRSGKK